jgi:hypothetical protein
MGQGSSDEAWQTRARQFQTADCWGPCNLRKQVIDTDGRNVPEHVD